MKHSKLFKIAVALLTVICCFGQINAQAVYYGDEYRQGQVIVKFKEASPIVVKSTSKGVFSTSSVSKVDNALKELGVSSMEQLMPLTGGKMALGGKIKTLSGRALDDTRLDKLYLVKFDSLKISSVEDAVAQLSLLPEVEYAEPNYIVHISSYGTEACSKEPLYSMQYALKTINMPQLWDMPIVETERPIIAILDTGVDITHPDIADNIWTNSAERDGAEFKDDDGNGYCDDLHGWDFVYNTAIIKDGMDRHGHGTHCAGIAAAIGDNKIGITGANPDALIMPIKVMSDDGTGDIATIVRGIDYARAAGAHVLSMSIGHGPSSSASEKEALLKASYNAIIVAAAGNNGANIYDIITPGIIFPGAYDFVVGVQASGQNNRLASFSNYDPDGPFFSKYEDFYNYEVLAPGGSIMSTFPGGKYKELSGTSMATPLVAGAVSRALQVKGYEAIKEYGFIGDIAMSRLDKSDELDASKLPLWNEGSRQVALRITACEIIDTINGDGDGQMDVGETIEIYPTVRSLWGKGENIKVEIVVASENVSENAYEIISNNVDFGYSLTSRGTGKSKKPLIIKIKENVNDGYNIPLTLNVTCDNSVDEMTNTSVTALYSVTNAIEIGGMITEDLTLYPDKRYIVTSNLAVPDNVTLTIKPGTELIFSNVASMSVSSKATFNCIGTPDSMITIGMTVKNPNRVNDCKIIFNKVEKISYAKITSSYPEIKNCILDNCIIKNRNMIINFPNQMTNVTIANCSLSGIDGTKLNNCNIIGNSVGGGTNYHAITLKNNIGKNNVFSNINKSTNNNEKNSCWNVTSPSVYVDSVTYYGTSKEEIADKGILDMDYYISSYGFGAVDLSNMRKFPYSNCHGIVWKVVVNGYDARDEFEEMPPLGVGTHKFEVYFNRKMKESAVPNISMGLQEPYNQTPIAENGSWSEYTYKDNDGGDVTVSVYTAYLTIDAKQAIDGLNRIYVDGAQDLENFEIPVENIRFNVIVQAAGSLSSGFMAEAGLGKVNLTWENPEENFDDMLGYNMYRYTVDANGVESDTVKINARLLEPEEVTFTDYDVVPGNTYYYYYKVMRTSLTENSPSKIVAATPLTASKGDANGSMSVDVADVVAEIAYLTNQNPQPFIFEAADVNSDTYVNILDVVGTLNIITSSADAMAMSANNTATYTIEDGILYVESPVALGGIQLLLNTTADNFEAMEALDGFELVTCRKDENTCLVLAYSMSGRTILPGKQAVINLGDALIDELILSDAKGNNLLAINGDVNGVGAIEAMQMVLPYPNPFSIHLTIPYIIGKEGNNNVEIRIADVAGRTVMAHKTINDFGMHSYTWVPGNGVSSGIYFVSLYVDGILMQTSKVVKR